MKSKHSEAQIYCCAEAGGGGSGAHGRRRGPGVGVSKPLRSMSGRRSSVGWTPVKRRSCGNWKMRTGDSSDWWRTSVWTARC